MTTKKIEINQDDYDLIELTSNILRVPHSKAFRTLMEIGLENILAYPTGIKIIDDKLSQPEFSELIFRLQNVWSKLK